MTAPFNSVVRTPTIQIDSTPLIVYGFDHASIIESIWVCNLNDKEIFISFNTLDERNNITQQCPLFLNQVLNPYESRDLMKGSVLPMQPGDLLYGNSTYSGDTFSCHVSGLLLLELTTESYNLNGNTNFTTTTRYLRATNQH